MMRVITDELITTDDYYASKPAQSRSSNMPSLRDVLHVIREKELAKGKLRGLFHLAIGRKILFSDDSVVSNGVTWRELANLLKVMRYDKDLVQELGLDPEELSPRDRFRFWYTAISSARPDSVEANQQAELLALALKPHGFKVCPGTSVSNSSVNPAQPPGSKTAS